MSLVAKAGEKRVIKPIANGNYTAVCYGVVDLGTQYNEQYDKAQDKVVIMWDLIDETIEIDGEEVPRTLTKTYTRSLHERSQLRKDLKSWRGREFTDDELRGFKLTNIIGVPCLVQVSTTETANGTYTNIDAVASLPKGMEKPKSQLARIVFDSEDFDREEYDALPKWMQERLMKAEGFKDRLAAASAGVIEPIDDFPGEDDEDLPF